MGADGADPEGSLYGEPEIAFLEQLWGDGFLSPGDLIDSYVEDIPLLS